jgi:uncharacterized membrane protein (DUF373 family)
MRPRHGVVPGPRARWDMTTDGSTMQNTPRWGAALRTFETTVVILVGVLLSVAVAIAVAVLYVALFAALSAGLAATLASTGGLQVALQNVFGGVLLVLLGMELIDTLKVYFAEHSIRTEVILIVAMIAVGRHIIQIDYEHTSGLELIGMATIMVALAVSYFLVKKSRIGLGPPDQSSGSPGH